MRFPLALSSSVKALIVAALLTLALSGCYKQSCPTYGHAPDNVEQCSDDQQI